MIKISKSSAVTEYFAKMEDSVIIYVNEDILTNKIYIGDMVQNKRNKVKDDITIKIDKKNQNFHMTANGGCILQNQKT